MPAIISAITNTAELMGVHAFARHQQSINQAATRLATGLRINRPADDPSGFIASEQFSREAVAVRKRIEALERDQFRLSAREGALSVVSDLAIHLQALVTQGANAGGLSDDEKSALQEELDGVIEAIEFVHNTSTFEGERIFKQWTARALGEVFDLPPAPPEPPEPPAPLAPGEAPAPSEPPRGLTIEDLKSGGALSIDAGNLELAQQLVDGINDSVNNERASIGALQKDFYDSQISALQRELESLTSIGSQIRDADFAVEVSNLVRAQILQEASLQAILIARDSGARVLGLLGGARI